LASEATSDKDDGGRSFSFRRKRKRNKKRARLEDVEMGVAKPTPRPESESGLELEGAQLHPKRPNLVQFALAPGLEQNMPADAVLAKEGANDVGEVNKYYRRPCTDLSRSSFLVLILTSTHLVL
jgi:metal transporter CNNM